MPLVGEAALAVAAPTSGRQPRVSGAPPSYRGAPQGPIEKADSVQNKGGAEAGEGGTQPKYSPQSHSTRVHVGMRLNNWVVVSRIGAGSFGETFSAIDMRDLPPFIAPLGDASALPPLPTGSPEIALSPPSTAPSQEEIKKWLACLPSSSERKEYCMKVEQESRRNVLRVEAAVLKKVQSCSQVVRYVGSGCTGGIHFLVMEKLGPDLAKIRRCITGGKFNIYTTLKAGISCLKAIREVHERGIVHRDIKPSNFIIGFPGTPEHTSCFLIDFGLARQFRRPTGELREPRECPGFHGTSRYASVASHHHQELGRVDDLWSLLFMLIEFATGTLPWRKFKVKEKIAVCKEASLKPKLVRNLPREFQTFLSHLKSLKFEDEPNYDLLLACMYHAIDRRGYPEDKPLDWELIFSPDKTLEKEEKEGAGFREEKKSFRASEELFHPGQGDGAERNARANHNDSHDSEEKQNEKTPIALHHHHRSSRDVEEKGYSDREKHHRRGERGSAWRKSGEGPRSTEGAFPSDRNLPITPLMPTAGGAGEKEGRRTISETKRHSRTGGEGWEKEAADGVRVSRKGIDPEEEVSLNALRRSGLQVVGYGAGHADPREGEGGNSPSHGPHRERLNERDRHEVKQSMQGNSSLEQRRAEEHRNRGVNGGVNLYPHHHGNAHVEEEEPIRDMFSPSGTPDSSPLPVDRGNSSESQNRLDSGHHPHRPRQQRGAASPAYPPSFSLPAKDGGEISPTYGEYRRTYGNEKDNHGTTNLMPAGYYEENGIDILRGNTGLTDTARGKREEDVGGMEGQPQYKSEAGRDSVVSRPSGVVSSSGGVKVPISEDEERRDEEQRRASLNLQNRQNGLTNMPLPPSSSNSVADAAALRRKAKKDNSINCACLVC